MFRHHIIHYLVATAYIQLLISGFVCKIPDPAYDTLNPNQVFVGSDASAQTETPNAKHSNPNPAGLRRQ